MYPIMALHLLAGFTWLGVCRIPPTVSQLESDPLACLMIVTEGEGIHQRIISNSAIFHGSLFAEDDAKTAQ